MAVLYGCIVHSLLRQPYPLLKNGQPMTQTAARQRRQIVVMLLAVVVMFFICILPFRVVSIWLMYVSMETLMKLGFVGYYKLLNFVRVMFYLNSACNPVLYNMFSTKFRKAFGALCGCTAAAWSRGRQRTALYSSGYSTRSVCRTTLPASEQEQASLREVTSSTRLCTTDSSNCGAGLDAIEETELREVPL